MNLRRPIRGSLTRWEFNSSILTIPSETFSLIPVSTHMYHNGIKTLQSLPALARPILPSHIKQPHKHK